MKAILNFLSSEKGNHVLEYTGVAIIIAGGTIAGIKTVKDGMIEKLADLNEATDVDTEGDTGGEGG